MSFRVEAWADEHGVTWELVQMEGGGDCLIREGWSRLDYLDGDAREGVQVIARFEGAEDARAFLLGEGFKPLR